MSQLTISPPRSPPAEGSTLGYKRLAAHLQLPLTPHSYDNEFEDAYNNNGTGIPSSSSTIEGHSWSVNEGDERCQPLSAELRSVFDDWDEDEMPAFEVSIDEDGAQVLHIPCESLYFEPPTPPRSVSRRTFLEGRSNQPSPASSSFSPFPIITRPFPQSPTFEIRISKPDPSIHAASPSEPLPRKPLASPSLEPDTPTPKTKTLVLDTTFLSSLPTTLNLSALSSSWCTPIRSAPNMVLASRWNQREEADVPCSAVAFSPTDGFGEMHFGLIRHQTPSFA